MRRPRAARKVLQIGLVSCLIGLASAGCVPIGASPPSAQVSSPTSNAAPGPREVLDGIPVGFTEEGHPYRGAADSPVTLIEYSDYLCPYCARHATETVPALIERYIRTGQVKWVFRDFPIASLHPTSAQGHMAAQCVGEQGAALYWRMHDLLFATQSQWNQLPDPGAYLAQVAQDVGADRAAYSTCMASGRSKAVVNEGIAAAEALGFNGTPTFQFLGGKGDGPYTLEGAQPVERFASYVDALLAGDTPPEAVQEVAKKPELPFWAKPEGLKPNPARPGFTMAGDPYKGNPQAAVAVVEFSDFQCPSCGKHALEAQPAVDKEFVDTGKIQWVFKNLPLQMHPQAAAAAAAAECAGEQGHFWDMYHLLFERVDQWTVDNPDPALERLAEELSLEAKAFSTCLTGRKALERVLSDLYDAKGAASVTPTFIVLADGQGTVLQGSGGLEQFTSTLRGMLEAAGAGAP